MLLSLKNWDGVSDQRSCVSAFEHKIGLRLNQVSTYRTAKQGPLQHPIPSKSVASIVLPLQVSMSAWTTELPVECVLHSGGWGQFIHVAFDGAPGEFRV